MKTSASVPIRTNGVMPGTRCNGYHRAIFRDAREGHREVLTESLASRISTIILPELIKKFLVDFLLRTLIGIVPGMVLLFIQDSRIPGILGIPIPVTEEISAEIVFESKNS